MTDEINQGALFPDDIDSEPAGPELDALLAERVLGAKVSRRKEWTGYENWIATTPDGEELYILLSPHSVYGAAPFWNPSLNPSDAQVLVQHLFRYSDYKTMSEEVTEEKVFYATLWAQRPVGNDLSGARSGDKPQHLETQGVTGTGPTQALAICRAVYKAASGIRPRETGDNIR